MSDTGRPPPAGCRIVLDPRPGVTAALLSAAFSAEPGMRWICGTDPARRRAWFTATEALLTAQHGARRYLLERDGVPAAAAWVTVPGRRPPQTAAARWLVRALRGCGPAAVARTAEYRRRERGLIPAGAAVLEFVGVLEQFRGTGLGGLLVRRAVSDVLAEPGGGPVHLSTTDPHNVTLYRRLWFEVDGSFPLPGGLRATAMSLSHS